ncbi:MAG: GNAT family N-acetyltransferase [Chryseobacterium sp. 39-10]|jgi:PhnO protein|nr:GNAT family N-acetyltransferase [Chryseobacterium sp.]OJV47837.1 MAG: GNAT family N-acetyltransferase [Chryseobacterium sp. 39-10]
MTEITIRKIEQKDLEFIYKSICNLQNEVFDKNKFEQIFIENISNADYLYLIAENEIEYLGFITFHTQNLLHHLGNVGEIQEFYIIPKQRGKGIGKKLIAKIFEYSENKNLRSIEVTTSKKRIENIEVYENLGFKLSHNKFTIYK